MNSERREAQHSELFQSCLAKIGANNNKEGRGASIRRGCILIEQLVGNGLPDSLSLKLSIQEAESGSLEALCEQRLSSSTRTPLNVEVVEVKDRLCVDVTHTRLYPGNSGIQRVVRGLVTTLRDNFDAVFFEVVNGNPRILESGEINTLVEWEKLAKKRDLKLKSLYRSSPALVKKAFRLGRRCALRLRSTLKTPEESVINSVVLFQNCSLFLPELLDHARIAVYPSLCCLFQRKIALLYDLIPISHPEYCVGDFSGNHVGYLKVLASSFDRVVGISQDASDVFRRYVNALGFPEPDIDAALLPFFEPSKSRDILKGDSASVPEVVMVAGLDPRKNHYRSLLACEALWKKGVKFRLRLVGSKGWMSDRIYEKIESLEDAGHDLIYERRYITDHEMVEFVSSARVSLFVSEIEGFGLPIIESLYFGTPVMTSNHGSMLEISELYGGCVTLPFDDVEAISDALEKFVVDAGYAHTVYQSARLDAGFEIQEYMDKVFGNR